MDPIKQLNDAHIDLQLGLVGLLVMIGLVAATLWFIVANAPFETKAEADKMQVQLMAEANTDRKLQAQLNQQLTATLQAISNTNTSLEERISNLQDDEIQMQQWLIDNQTPQHPYVPRDESHPRKH